MTYNALWRRWKVLSICSWLWPLRAFKARNRVGFPSSSSEQHPWASLVISHPTSKQDWLCLSFRDLTRLGWPGPSTSLYTNFILIQLTKTSFLWCFMRTPLTSMKDAQFTRDFPSSWIRNLWFRFCAWILHHSIFSVFICFWIGLYLFCSQKQQQKNTFSN